jgi:hypothetical protein
VARLDWLAKKSWANCEMEEFIQNVYTTFNAKERKEMTISTETIEKCLKNENIRQTRTNLYTRDNIMFY